MWDMQLRYNQQTATSPWVLHQPNDEPMNEYYREKFEIDLAKQTSFLKREKNLVWWQRYSPAINQMPNRMVGSDMYNMMAKTLNSGDLDALNELEATSFDMFTFTDFDPFGVVTPASLEIYDGGTYAYGSLVTNPVNILDGSTYANGTQAPVASYALNGGTY
jgi:hypothetical protein